MHVRSMLVAYDFSDVSRRALEWARFLRARLHAALVVVHIDVDPLSQTALRADASLYETPDQLARRLRWLEDELRREVSERFGPDDQAVRVHVARGRPAEALADLALELGADLVIVGASGKSAVDRVLLGSTTQELVRTCALPVMTVH